MHNNLRQHNYFKKIISSIAVFCILVSQGCYFPVSFAADEQDVSISISPKPKVDIVLSKARSKTDTNQFENDIKQALINREIDSDDVQVSAVSAEQVNIETAFSWQRDVSSSIGSLSITNNGQNVVMYGNRSNPGKNAIWIEPDGNQEQKFTFGYSINFGDSFNAAGMLLRVKETNKSNHTLSGYALSFNNTGNFRSLSNSNGAIWKFVYDGDNNSNMSITLVKSLSINTSGTLTVSATDSEIRVSGGGLSSEVVCQIDENYTTGNGFGFFSDHYSHGCDSIGSFQLTNINLTAVTTKSFKEVLQLPEWRDNSLRFLVNVDDYENEELDDQTAYSELLTKLMNEDIHYISWGNSKNEAQFENLIAANSSKGMFTSNADYNSAIGATADYIKEIVDRNTSNLMQYVVVNEPISINVRPEGIMSNTIDEEWPYGKWQINHDHLYYENDMGQFSESGKLIDSLITTFDKTGKYEIFYKNIPVYPREIYVHRKPIAAIGLSRNGTSVTLNSLSYDLDQMSEENSGISEEEWKWKISDSSTWTNGKLTTIDPSKDYIVSLRVKDNQEAWSNATTLYITSNENSAPVALFSIAATNISKYEELEIVDASYDPAGGQITSYNWEVYKDNNLIYSGSTPKTSYLNDDIGEYTYYLTVTNAKGKVSEKFGRKVTVTDDNYAPEVVILPVSSDWGTSQTVHLDFSDRGGSGVKHYKYAITENQSIPTTWSDPIAKISDDITLDGNGQKYLHIIAEDNAGNVSEDRIAGPYNMDNLNPEFIVTGDINTIVINSLTLNVKTIDNLSGIKSVTINDVPITNDSNCEFTQNGTYTLKAEDNAGNINTGTITIENIHYECNKGLNHPHYSSSYDNCPICDEFEGLEMTNNSKVYNSELQGISYINPSNATIVEYYDSKNEQVEDVGTYDYSLKVIYNGEEYNTGVDGIFTIYQKDISINNIETIPKKYDTNNVIEITGGSLIGVIDDDIVAAIVPKTGLSEAETPGNWKVSINNIELTGEDAHNYNLIQPEYGSITTTITQNSSTLEITCPDKIYDGNIPVPSKVSGLNTSPVTYTYYKHGEEEPIPAPTKVGEYDVVGYQESDGNYEAYTSDKFTFRITEKEITIEDIVGIPKKYDTNNVIEITGGNLVGLVDGDDIQALIPKTGLSEAETPGNWKVSIDNIELTGNDAYNYILIQPEYGNITTDISMANSKLTIKCDDKVYDGVSPTPSKIDGLNISDVTYIYYKHGEEDKIKAPTKVGEYDVIGYQKTDGNYEAVVSDRITFKITPKEITIKDIVAKEKEYDGSNVITITGGNLVGLLDKDKNEVKAVIPKTGLAEKCDVGIWKVKLDTIKLEGKNSDNYTLVQPKYGDITVKISKQAPMPIPQTGELIIPIVSLSIGLITLSLGFVALKKFIFK